MFLQADIDDYNRRLEQWRAGTHAAVLSSIAKEGVQHSKNSPNKISLSRSVKTKNYQREELTNRIGFSFNRSMVWLQKGVSRGHPKSNPRQVKDVFNGPVDKAMDELADIAADMQGNLIINSLLIK